MSRFTFLQEGCRRDGIQRVHRLGLPAQQVKRKVEHLTTDAAEAHKASVCVVEPDQPILVVGLLQKATLLINLLDARSMQPNTHRSSTERLLRRLTWAILWQWWPLPYQ